MSRVTLADFRLLQDQMLLLKHENYALREAAGPQPSPAAPWQGKRHQGVPLDAAEPPASPTASSVLYPTELNPFGGSSVRPHSPGLVTGSGVTNPSQGSTGDADGCRILTPAGHTPSAVHAVRQQAARRAFALRRAATLRLVWLAWRSAHAHTCILKNFSAAVKAARLAPASPAGVSAGAAAAASFRAEAAGLGSGLAVGAGCFASELRGCEDQIHTQTLRHAQQCSGFWRRAAAWRHALIRQRERSHARLYFHAWRTAQLHARQMARLAGLATALAEVARE